MLSQNNSLKIKTTRYVTGALHDAGQEVEGGQDVRADDAPVRAVLQGEGQSETCELLPVWGAAERHAAFRVHQDDAPPAALRLRARPIRAACGRP